MTTTIAKQHDAVLLDLDGVVYLRDQPIEPAPATIRELRASGVQVAFVTNNAARPPADIANGLQRLGIDASADLVWTSAMAAADLLQTELPTGAKVLIVGTEGLAEAIRGVGLTAVHRAEDEPHAVVQGWSPELNWRLLAEAAVAIRAGAFWVATNRDATLPSPRGPLPGNGSMVAALETATDLHPRVVGKPEPELFRAVLKQLGVTSPLVIGDRLDTDIAGANRVGLASLLVLSGVADADALIAAPEDHRPTYVGADIGAVLGPATAITSAAPVGDGLDELRAKCREAWRS
jgi:HAD superfamily hydrolase (TIGR01450 family)